MSNDNPFSEAQFRTFKYRPEFPKRFGALEQPFGSPTMGRACELRTGARRSRGRPFRLTTTFASELRIPVKLNADSAHRERGFRRR